MGMDAVQTLRYMAELNSLPRDVADARIEEALKTVGLADEAKKKTERILARHEAETGIAELLVKDPRSHSLDEPTLGLDPTRQTA